MSDFTPTPEAVEAVRHCMSREFSLTDKQARAAIAAFVEAEGLGGDRAINLEPGRRTELEARVAELKASWKLEYARARELERLRNLEKETTLRVIGEERARVAELEAEQWQMKEDRDSAILDGHEDRMKAVEARARLQRVTELLRQFVSANQLEHPWLETSPSLTTALAALAGEDDG